MDADQRRRLHDGLGSAADFDPAGLPWGQHVVDDHGGAAGARDVAVLLGGLQPLGADVNAAVAQVGSYLRKRRIQATISEPADQKNNRLRRGSTGGRPPRFDSEIYKQRNVVERCINKFKAHRAVATRYDKRDYTFRGTIDLASIRIWLRDPVP
jgi:hypothetical protein